MAVAGDAAAALATGSCDAAGSGSGAASLCAAVESGDHTLLEQLLASRPEQTLHVSEATRVCRAVPCRAQASAR